MIIKYVSPTNFKGGLVKKVLILVALAFNFSAGASDHWDSCSDAYGEVKMENGVLRVGQLGEIAEESVQVKVVNILENTVQKCKLKKHGTEVISYENTVSVEEVTYTMEENDSPTKSFMICERGGSGIPANDSCVE